MCLILHFVAAALVYFQVQSSQMVLLGDQAPPLLLQAPCPVPFKRAQLHLQAVKPSRLLQFDLQALMA